MKPSDLNLYLVGDRSWLKDQSMDCVIESVLAAGVTFLQYREKALTLEENKINAAALKVIAEKYHIPFVVNDDIDLALEIGADGVHVGQSDLEASQARTRIGDDKILGVSVRTVEEAINAKAAGADYLGVGAMFPTDTKKDACAVSFETLREICKTVDLPVVAIGGIQLSNLLQLQDSGIEGVAVISAILAQDDPAEATKNLKTLCKFIKRDQVSASNESEKLQGGTSI